MNLESSPRRFKSQWHSDAEGARSARDRGVKQLIYRSDRGKHAFHPLGDFLRQQSSDEKLLKFKLSAKKLLKPYVRGIGGYSRI